MLGLGSTALTMATVQRPGRNMQWAQIALAPGLTHISDEEWACAAELLFFHTKHQETRMNRLLSLFSQGRGRLKGSW